MGWLDKGFKNIVKGGKDLLSSPAGIMLLGAAAPWLSAGLGGTGMMAGLATKYPTMTKLLSSPWIKNALTNAAMQGGIATLTGSKHPWKAMGYSALASMPFTALQSAQAANQYNILGKELIGSGDLEKANWWDYALGTEMPAIPGDVLGYKDTTDFLNTRMKDYDKLTDYDIEWPKGAYKNIKSLPPGGPTLEPILGKGTPAPDIGSYFLNPEKAAKFADNKGIAGAMSALTGDLDLMAAAVPQITGMYGGRMTEEEQWLAGKEKQIRLWAFQHGIPYEEAKEIWKDGYRNPYYETKTPKDYNFQFNKGGSVPYKDDYTAGGSAVGPGTGTSDSIRPVALSDGEFVFTEQATNNFPGGAGGLYSLMNSLDPNSERPEEARV